MDIEFLLSQIMSSAWAAAIYFAEGDIENSNRLLEDAKWNIARTKSHFELLTMVMFRAQAHTKAMRGNGNVGTTASELEEALRAVSEEKC